MADADNETAAPISEDDWAAAMNEQATTEGGGEATQVAEPENADADASAEDDWAAAMAEQAASEATPDAEAAQVAADLASAASSASAASTVSSPYQAKPASQLFEDFNSPPVAKPNSLNDFDMILDIPVQITVELGRTKISIRNLLQLAHGSVVELEGLAGEPMDVLVNGTLIAQGEVVVVNDKFGIRLTDIITPAERMRKINH